MSNPGRSTTDTRPIAVPLVIATVALAAIGACTQAGRWHATPTGGESRAVAYVDSQGPPAALPRIRSTASPKAGLEAKARRWDYFQRMLRDPATGEIPEDIRLREMAYARTLPWYGPDGALRTADGTTFERAPAAVTPALSWTELGPTNIGGRTRALAIDVGDPNTIIVGSASGGIWKSTDSGATWTLKTGTNQDLGITSIAQNRRPGWTNQWFAATGEFAGNSATDAGFRAFYFGGGLYRSIDNGETWQQLASTIGGNPSVYDNAGDIVTRVAVSPTTGSIYFASNFFGIFRSTDGGANFVRVLGEFGASQWCDVLVTGSGTVVATLSAPAGAFTVPGIYRSTNDGASFTSITPASFPAGSSGRTVLGAAPSNPDVVYALTDTQTPVGGTGATAVRFWKITLSTGVALDRSANVPQFGGTTGDFHTQGGYNMMIGVKPDDEDFAVIGGRNLWRSTDGFATAPTIANSWIGGYTTANNSFALYPNNHPDHHVVAFDPLDPTLMWNGNDGGLYVTNVTTPTVTWVDMNQGYNVTQFYTTAIRDVAGNALVVGGTQDNGSLAMQYDAANPGQAFQVLGGDGATAHLGATFSYTSAQTGFIVRNPYDANGLPNPSVFAVVDPNAVPDASRLFVHPFAVDPVTDNVMYFPADNVMWRHPNLGGIPNFTPNPAGWVQLSNVASPANTDVTALAVSTTPANVLYFGASGFSGSNTAHGIFRLANADVATDGEVDISVPGVPGGAYVHDVAVNPADADEILVAFSNYNIVGLYHSTNAGQTYTAVEGNLTGTMADPGPSLRSVSILPTAGGTQYFVATSTGLYSTEVLDGTNTVWGLEGATTIANAVVDAVISRSGDDMVVAGTHGRGVFVGTPGPPPPASGVTLMPAPASPQNAGVAIEWTAQGQGGSGNYEYVFFQNGPATGNVWVNVQPYSADNTFTWNTSVADAGRTFFAVFVRNQGTMVGFDARSASVPFTIDAPATGVTLVPAPTSPRQAGAAIEWTAQGQGGSGNYEYVFFQNGPATGNVWVNVQPYSADNTYTWNTTGADRGVTFFAVFVRNQGSTAGFEARSPSVPFTIEPPPATGVTLAPAPASPQVAGTTITWTAQGQGGSGTYEYVFFQNGPATGNVWVNVQPYSADNTYTWNTTGADIGVTFFAVFVRNQGSTAGFEARSPSVAFTIGPPPASSVTLEAAAPSL